MMSRYTVKIVVPVLALFALSSVSFLAADDAPAVEKDYAAKWKSHEVVLDEKKPDTENDRITEFLRTARDERFSVTYAGELSGDLVRVVLRFNKELRSWKSMKVANIDFSVIDSRNIEIAVTPESFIASGTDYTEYVSGGIFFSYTGELYYNFRILVDKIFVNIKGSFIDEDSFVEKLAAAVEDPRRYVNNRDPEYLLEKIDKLELSLHRLRYSMIANMVRKPVDQKVIDEIVEMKKLNPAWRAKEIEKALKDKEIKVPGNVIEAVLEVYFNEY